MGVDVNELIDGVIGREGGYSDNPADRGGPTMWGITEQVARAHLYTGDMRNLPRDTAIDIYRAVYWEGIGLDRVAAIAPDIAVELFDAAVNMGPAWPGKFLQRVLNVLNRNGKDYPDIAVDGQIGAMTISAISRLITTRDRGLALRVLMRGVLCLRGARYIEIAEGNPSQEAFEFGWLANRLGVGLGQ